MFALRFCMTRLMSGINHVLGHEVDVIDFSNDSSLISALYAYHLRSFDNLQCDPNLVWLQQGISLPPSTMPIQYIFATHDKDIDKYLTKTLTDIAKKKVWIIRTHSRH